MNKLDIRSLTFTELSGILTKMGQPQFRSRQIYEWIHKQKCKSFNEMTNLPESLRKDLEEKFFIQKIKIQKKLISSSDGTIKYLFALQDGNLIESAVMQYHHGISICISTQVGCKMGCSFCASTINGFIRNLTASEMLCQIEAAQEDSGFNIGSIVMMGVGEPLDNYDNTIRFLKILSDPQAKGFSLRHVSLSTSGLVDQINRLREEKMQLTLSISLHAPTDEMRRKLMPVSQKWSLSELMEACKKYIEYTGRRISFEYIMLKGINDSKEDAKKLAVLLKGLICHVNLIGANQVKEKDYRSSDRNTMIIFKKMLTDNGINTTIRRKMGSDIDAACGQLRRDVMEKGG